MPCNTISDAEAYQACVDSERELELRFDRVIELEQVIATRSVARLAQHLQAAERAHHDFEQQHGVDSDWPRFYAQYLLGVR